MQVAVRARQLHLDGHDAAKRVGQGGEIFLGNAVVGDDNVVALQRGLLGLDEGHQVFAADLLLAFEDEGDVAGKFRAGLEVGLYGLQVGEVLALVVAGTAGEEIAALDARLEGRRLPQLERLGRLHVVVAVDHVVRLLCAGLARRAGHEDGVALGRMQLGFQADGAAVLQQPITAGRHVLGVFRLGGDAGEAEVVAEFLQEPVVVRVEVVEDGLHVCRHGAART